MKDMLPLFVALIGAGFGAYFAILKSKSERLWIEKYEALKNIVDKAECIAHESNLTALEVLDFHTMTDEERLILSKEVLTSKNEIRKSISRLKLLFKEAEIEEILNVYQEFYSAILKMKNMPPEEYHDDLEFKAIDLVNATIKLAQRKCT